MTTSVSDAPASAEPKRGRLGLVLIGVLAAVTAGGFGILAAHTGQTPGIVPQTITYDVRDDTTVEISYSVAKPKGDEVHCKIDAYDVNFVVLAEKAVTVPAGTSGATRSDTLRTPRRATGARVKECRKA
ncbi:MULTISPECIES: DUF4307 domain-containing protein [Actinomadura]|uniref:DUF4307 domain-containing protein n=1 Tax=Actinomadura litoris TaxID=2678616 RepID=A0A7K1L6A2_9ACTN|nr:MULTISPECIES: DUF4307 domain-containing protein [Actinomadura]MBT2213921.1 DUF4307 domain-containing protein [Actinomadura sp. NEAU-AAG7]MUN39919.1 DUF4307 domain-containing protein [Actinomadura litoris]